VSAPIPFDPCLETVARPTLAGNRRIRVVEVLATGTNGGAQEHLHSLVTRLDQDRYDVSVVALSGGSAVRKLQKADIPVLVIDDPDDTIAVGALAAHLSEVRADVVHAHMYRAETVATRAIIALGEAGQRRPYLVATIHSSRIRSLDDQRHLRELTPHMDRLIAVSKAIQHKLVDEQRCDAPVSLIYNGVDLERYENQEACCTLPEEYGMEPGSQIVGVVARLEPEKGHPTLLEAWPAVLREVPDAYLLIVGEGSRRDALEAQTRELRCYRRIARPRGWSSSKRWRCLGPSSRQTSGASPR
jgi:glycosyltransferase involved in cell wall biosynthesis